MFSNVIDAQLAESLVDDVHHYKRQTRCTLDDIAQAVKINANTFRGYASGTDLPKSGNLIVLNRAICLPRFKHTFDELWDARDIPGATHQDIMHGLATVGEVAAKASAAVLDALADGKITDDERDACRKKCAALQAEVQRMSEMLEAPAKKQATNRPATLKDAEAMSKGKGRAA